MAMSGAETFELDSTAILEERDSVGSTFVSERRKLLVVGTWPLLSLFSDIDQATTVLLCQFQYIRFQAKHLHPLRGLPLLK
jgi:hypothetical protein